MKIASLIRPSLGGAGLALSALLLATACGDGDGPTGPGDGLAPSPPALSHGDFGDSDGIYRIPYVDGSSVIITRDHHSHTPPNRIDMAGDAAGLEIVAAVFDEERDGTDSFESATDMLWTNDSRGEMYHLLDRQLLTAWLNFAHGGYGWDDVADTDGDGMGDTAFSDAITAAETVRLDPDATRAELGAQKDMLESISLMDGG